MVPGDDEVLNESELPDELMDGVPGSGEDLGADVDEGGVPDLDVDVDSDEDLGIAVDLRDVLETVMTSVHLGMDLAESREELKWLDQAYRKMGKLAEHLDSDLDRPRDTGKPMSQVYFEHEYRGVCRRIEFLTGSEVPGDVEQLGILVRLRDCMKRQLEG